MRKSNMDNNPTLIRIANHFNGLGRDEMTKMEKQIAILLIGDGYGEWKDFEDIIVFFVKE